MTRRLSVVLPALAFALVLAGCFTVPVLLDEDGDQPGPIAKVGLTATVCDVPIFSTSVVTRSDDPVEAECPPREELIELIEEDGLTAIPHQILVAFRVPAGARAPESLTVEDVDIYTANLLPIRSNVREVKRGRKARLKRLDVGEPDVVTGDVHFRHAPEMEQAMLDGWDYQPDVDGPDVIELARRPAIISEEHELLGDGQKIVGYISDALPGTVLDEMEIAAAFGLPSNGENPYPGPFNHLAAIGARIALPDDFLEGEEIPEDIAASRPIECLFAWNFYKYGNEDTALCPMPRIDLDLDEPLQGIDLPTQDVALKAGDAVTVEAGQTATVPFTVRTAGPAGGDFGLEADVSFPGGKATPRDARPTFAGTGETEQPVTVEVPVGTEPGEYDVRLVAKGVDDEVRTATGRLVVTPKFIPPPPVTPITVEPTIRTPDNLYLRRGGVHFGYICTAPQDACAFSTAELYVDPSNLATARAAQSLADAGKLQLVGFGKFGARKDVRVERQARAFKVARRALRKGRTLQGLLIIRSGGDVQQVRGVKVRVKRPAA